jgi:hypothetical protein
VIRRRWTAWALAHGVDPGPGALSGKFEALPPAAPEEEALPEEYGDDADRGSLTFGDDDPTAGDALSAEYAADDAVIDALAAEYAGEDIGGSEP